MATSKLELAVGTGQWDAGLKKAQQALNSFTQAQGGLQQALAKDNGDMQKFIQMMGKIDSTANTTKGQMNDYKRVLEQLTTQYNQMSDAQKKSIGQDYLQTIDQLKQKFSQAKQQVEDFNKSLGEAGKVKMPETGGGLFSGGKLDGMLQVFGGNLMTKAAGMATGLAMEIGDAVKQGIELAKQGEGIRIAFERLGRGDILDGLREATHGTVTDLELMKAAVKFNDFKLPVEELGTMLAFAQQKAKDTGQSVDYMVDSIVTGLGRKSLMILDNLGLSAAEIKEKMKETGDMTKAVGAIIREQMQKAGDYVETAADRAAQANVSLQNKMEELGRKFAPLEEASNNFWTSMKIGILDVVGGPLTNLLNKLTEAGRLMNAYGNMGGSGKVGRMTANLAGANEGNRQSIYQQQQQRFWQYINPREQQIKDIRAWQRGERSEALQGRINAITQKYGSLDATKIQAEVDAAKKMLSEYQQAAKGILTPIKAEIDTSNAENNVASLTKKLNELKAQRAAAIKAGDSDLSKSLLKQINQTKADIRGLDPTALKTSGKTKTKTIYAEGTIGWQEQEVQRLTKAWKKAGDAVRDDYATQLSYAKQRLAEMTGGFDPGKMKDISGQSVNLTLDTEKLNDLQAQRKKAIASGDTELSKNLLEQINQVKSDPNGLTVPVKLEIKSPVEQWQGEIKRLQELIGQTWDSAAIDVYTQKIDQLNEKINEFSHTSVKGGESSSKAWSSTASAISSVGSAINAIDDPTAKIIGLVAQGIASVVSATGIATEKAAGQSRHWAEYLAAAASITAQMIATISQIHSASGYANGGIVKGNSYSGDNIPADTFVNAGELILNKSQQGAIASQLQNGGGGLRVTGVLRGEDLLISIDKSARRQGRGELVFWKNQ